MGQALYRKYRSKSLSEIVGQDHVTTTLSNGLKNGKISHAYLLTGPRGVGKTSIARILAHEINGLPYNDEAHLDIIEIDAASNRRIDEIRDLRDRVNTAPSIAKYKVYIIDEVHMLTKEAFNALLKTLEEPPAHVVFILATTEAHKLPETIVSRTQRYTFRPVPQDQVVNHLKSIAKQEKITIDDDALGLIAEHGEGSFRDSIGLLDQASNVTEHIAKADIERMLGLAPAEQIEKLVAAVGQGPADIVTVLDELYGNGYEPAMISGQLSAVLRSRIVGGNSTTAGDDLQMLERLLAVPAARSPKQLLEIVLLKSAVPLEAQPAIAPAVASDPKSITPPSPQTKSSNKPAVSRNASTPIAAPAPPSKPAALSKIKASTPSSDSSKNSPLSAMETTDITAIWQAVLNEIKKQYNTLYGIARMAKPEMNGDTLTLTLKFAFHQKRLNEAKNRKIFSDIISQLIGRQIDFVCVVGETGKVEVAPPQVADMNAISNIFGGGEVIES